MKTKTEFPNRAKASSLAASNTLTKMRKFCVLSLLMVLGFGLSGMVSAQAPTEATDPGAALTEVVDSSTNPHENLDPKKCPCGTIDLKWDDKVVDKKGHLISVDRKVTLDSLEFNFTQADIPAGATWKINIAGQDKEPIAPVAFVLPAAGNGNGKLKLDIDDKVNNYGIIITLEIPETDQYEACECTWYIYVDRHGDKETYDYFKEYFSDTTQTAEGKAGCDTSQTSSECGCECKSPKPDYGTVMDMISKLGSMHIEQELPAAPTKPGLSAGRLLLYRSHLGASAPVKADQLIYASVPTMKIVTEYVPGAEGSTQAVAHYQAVIRQASGFDITFEVKTGDETGLPIGLNVHSQARIQLLDVNEQPTSNLASCTIIRQYRQAGSYVDYDRSTGVVQTFVTRAGRVTDLTSVIDIVKVGDVIRQVKTEAGLLDVTELTATSFEVKRYQPGQVGAKVNGIYNLTGDPETRFIVAQDGANKVIQTRYYGTRREKVVFEKTGDNWTRTRYDANDNVVIIQKHVPAFGASKPYVIPTNPIIDIVSPESTSITRVTEIPSETVPEISRETVNFGRSMWGQKASTSQVYETSDRSEAPIERSYTFYDDINKRGSHGKIKSHTLSRGITRQYTYDEVTGHLLTATEAYLDNPTGKVISYDYTPHLAADTLDIGDFRPRTTTVTLNGTVASRTFLAAYFDGSTGEYTVISEVANSQTASFGDAANLRSVAFYYAPNTGATNAGRIRKSISVDKVVTLYSYDDNPSGFLYTIAPGGTATTLPGANFNITATGNLDINENPVAGYSVRSTSVIDLTGLIQKVTSEAYAIDRTNNDTAAWTDVAENRMYYNEQGYPVKTVEIDPITNRERILMECVWTNGQKTSMTDELGVTTNVVYDDLYRATRIEREAVAASADYEAQSAIVSTISGSTIRSGTNFGWMDSVSNVNAGGINLTSEQQRDYRGRVNYVKDENGYITTAVYNLEGTIATVTAPNTGSVTSTYHIDGRLKSQTGSALVDCFYNYTVNPTGGMTMEKSVVTASNPRKVACSTNMLGQTISCISPAYNGATVVNTTTYELGTGRALGSSSTAANTPNSIVQYNSIGVPIRTGISIDNNTLTLDSDDRIVDVETGIEKDTTGIWSFSKTYIYPEAGSATRKLLGSSRSKATGYSGLDIAYAESTDIAGNLSSGKATLDRSTGITQITSSAPGIASDSIATSYYGRLETTLTPGESNMALVDYDALGRVRQTKNPRHSAYSTIIYQANKTLVASTTNANGDTSAYQYYGNGLLGAGAVSQVTLPDSTTQHVSYDILGNVTSQWGSQMYPRAYEYDSYNQLSKLHTWKAQPSIPLDPANSAATTTWNYEQATGLLLNKRYADDKGTDYAYDTAGRTITKTLARETTPGSGSRLEAQYFYTAWGEHKSTLYNDTLTQHTNNVYDRLGRQTHSVQGTTAGQNTRVIDYTYDAATLLQTAERTRDGIFINDLAKDYLTDNSVTFDKTLATNYDTLLRVDGINVPNATNGTGNDYNLGYGYGTEGRLISITDQLNSKTFGYNYNPNSRNLLDELTSPIHKVVNAYETNRGVLLSKTNSTNTTATNGIETVSKFAYTVNSIGKRTQMILSGKAITDNGLANSTLTWDYTYNDKGELATANATSDNAAVATLTRTFNFDQIGNRIGITDNNGSSNYVSNALNQYNSITTTPTSGAPTTQAKNHDEDGNTTQDANKKYTFDAEDRLTKVTDLSDNLLVSYRYDAYSRRIQRTVANGDTVQYLYNSWNVIAEYEQTNGATTWTAATTRTWGLDISGTEQGAGGIGGLLAENQITGGTTTSYYPLYDGNGNITEYLDGTGAIVAHYEYDPFGKINLSTGAKAGDFEYQFSTKPLDTITGLHYYGYRWYDASNGRWINRDPIKEDGGMNVHNAFRGDPINGVDVLGLAVIFISDEVFQIDKKKIEIKKKSLEKLEKHIKEIETKITVEEFAILVKDKKVRCNAQDFIGTKDDYIKLVKRELLSEVIVINNVKELKLKLKEASEKLNADLSKDDQLIVALHGIYEGEIDVENSRGRAKPIVKWWFPTGYVKIKKKQHKLTEIQTIVKEVGDPAKLLSCFQDGKHMELVYEIVQAYTYSQIKDGKIVTISFTPASMKTGKEDLADPWATGTEPKKP